MINRKETVVVPWQQRSALVGCDRLEHLSIKVPDIIQLLIKPLFWKCSSVSYTGCRYFSYTSFYDAELNENTVEIFLQILSWIITAWLDFIHTVVKLSFGGYNISLMKTFETRFHLIKNTATKRLNSFYRTTNINSTVKVLSPSILIRWRLLRIAEPFDWRHEAPPPSTHRGRHVLQEPRADKPNSGSKSELALVVSTVS